MVVEPYLLIVANNFDEQPLKKFYLYLFNTLRHSQVMQCCLDIFRGYNPGILSEAQHKYPNQLQFSDTALGRQKPRINISISSPGDTQCVAMQHTLQNNWGRKKKCNSNRTYQLSKLSTKLLQKKIKIQYHGGIQQVKIFQDICAFS